MSVRAIDNNNDWLFGKGKQNYKTEQQEIIQNIKTSLQSWKNNCFFDLEAGVDWYNIIGSRNKNNYANSQILGVVMNVKGVIKINSINIINNTNSRSFSIEINIDTIYSNGVNIIQNI